MSSQEPLDDETLWGVPGKTAQGECAMTQEELEQIEIDQRIAEAQLTMLLFLEDE